MQKLGSSKVGVIPGHGAAPDVEIRRTGTAFMKGTPAKASLNIPEIDLPEIRKWVGLEERIVHDYQERRNFLSRPAVSSQVLPPKPASPAFETFSTQTTASLASRSPQSPEPLAARASWNLGRFLWVLGWVVAGVMAFFYIQGTFSLRGAAGKVTQLQGEKQELARSYAALEKTSASQDSRIRLLDSQVLGLTRELKAAKQQTTIAERALEKKYRQELMRITLQYETRIEELQSALQTKESIFAALKAQISALEEIADQGGMAAVSGAASHVLSSFSSNGTGPVGSVQVLEVNARQGFFVINAGSEQGVRYADEVTVSGSLAGRVEGRVDRVYPTMATVLVADPQTLSAVLEGDTVALS